MNALLKQNWHKQKGFTLIEIMLVLVIISIILYGSITYIQQRAQTARINRTVTQMQQILNAGLAFYIANGQWPAGPTTTSLQPGYLPAGTITNPWGLTYNIASASAGASGTFATAPPLFYVWTTITSTTPGAARSTALAILGNLPMGYTSASSGSPPTNPAQGGSSCSATTTACKVVATVNIPGQNLNNARGINFSGLYHHGGCVPVPQCPVDTTGQTMTPEVVVVPVSISGLNEPYDNSIVYPISSFTAYARGPAATPPACDYGTAAACSPFWTTSSSSYWRVCVQVITEQGEVAFTRPNDDRWGSGVTLAAFTRCAVTNEPAGSNFQVYTH